MSSAPAGRRSWLRSALIFVLVLEGALILWSLDRFHREVRSLTEETSAVRLAVERLRDLGPGVASAPGGHPGPGVPQGGGLVVAGMAEPGTLNRYAGFDGATRTICNYIHDGLISLDPDTVEPAPGLATGWEVESGGRALLFHLRQGVVWSDGSPFTADDVLYTCAVLRDRGIPGGGMASLMASVRTIERVPPHSLRFVLERPSFRALTQIGTGLRVLCAAWWREQVAAAAAAQGLSRAPAPGEDGFARLFCGITAPGPGTGPYVFDPERSWRRGAHITLHRNRTTWWKAAFPDRWNLASIRYRFLSDAVAQWEALAAGEVDMLTADSDRWEAEKKRDPRLAAKFRFVRYDHPGLGYAAILWNCHRPPFDDARVRRAMTMLIDRDTIVNELFGGEGPLATCVFKPGTPEYSTDLEPLPFDREGALRELALAGWKDTDENGSLEADGAGLSFVLVIPAEPEDYRRLADLVVAWMKDAGIRVTVEAMEWTSFQARVFGARDFDAACVLLGHSDVLVDPYDRFHSSEDGPNGWNTSGLRDPRVDLLLEQARGELDRARRIAIYHQFNLRLHELQPHTLIRHPLVSAVVAARYRNAEVNRKGLVPERWYVPVELQLRDR